MSEGHDELFAVLASVHDEKTFLQFLRALQIDREASEAQEKATPSSPYGADARGWENTTIATFFEAAVAWAEDSSRGSCDYVPPLNPWRRCADIFYAAKGYE